METRPEIGNHIPTTELPAVGIDLTGSASKASGWAAIGNLAVSTRRIFTDAELIAETIKVNPGVIVLDSPLSLPAGRISVYDDDPGRQRYGITRACEREMLKRGIRSYPPLIRSMQKLTLRGISLADTFRTLGYQVIESFPGGIQDILGLPRKQKNLNSLITGLAEFGLTGQFSKTRISHDEIDAICAAVGGLFFLADEYETVGDPYEGLIILPKIEYTQRHSETAEYKSSI
ncbi:MAG: DUF429 domain-containing protein [Pedobacter sp.]|nr:MAG: DUF429 domain-containing protein [Pedobacter sp.]